MDFNILISELRSSSEHLSSNAGDKSLLSSKYCNNACKALQRITDTDSEYDNIITGLWLIVAHFAEQAVYLRPVPALSELCFKLFRQCAKAVLNIQWQNLDEDSSVRQNFLISLANLHAKLVPFDFPRFRLLETLTENPWTNPTLAKIMGGEVEASDKEEVQEYIEQEDPIILQLRVDMMLQENCEEYALNLCCSCLLHPELATDLSLRITQLSLLYKMGNEDKLQEECQRLSIQEALRIIKKLSVAGQQKELYTVLAQTFMVQNWIRPSDTDSIKELLRLWIRHQLLVDREHDQFKDSIWAMAKLSHSTEQIVIIIDVLREECGDTFLQLYVDMSIFAVKVDKGQMETSIKEGSMEAAAARKADMASVCAKLSCLCHHASLKVGRICALTSFALKPSEESFNKIGAFYGQGTNCCGKCGKDNKGETSAVNPATLYEVERLLNMLRPDYLNPDSTYPQLHVMCRRFLLDSLKYAQMPQKNPRSSTGVDNMVITQVEGPGKKKPGPSKVSIVFEALFPQDINDRQTLLAKLRMQNVASFHSNSPASNRALSSHSTPVSASANSNQQYHPQQEISLNRGHLKGDKQGNNVKAAQTKNSPKQQIATLLQQQQQQALQTQQVSQIIQLALKKDPIALQQISKTAPAAVVQAIASIMKGTNVRPTSQPQLQSSQTLPTVSTLLRPTSASSSQLQSRQQPAPRKYPRPQLYAQPIIVSTASNSNLSLPHGRVQSLPSNSNPAELHPSLPPRVVPTPTRQQRSETLNLSRAQVQGVRQFMQSQLSALQPGQGASTLELSVNSSGSSSSGTSSRGKTTVELAEQAAIARELKKQQQKQARLVQQSAAFHTSRSPATSAMPQIIGTMPHQEGHSGEQHFRQQPVPRQSGSNIFASVESFQTNPIPCTTSQSNVLPSSDELLGSITGIDDTIINDLLQDSGLLANTFPDIEVDISGEDRGRKGLDAMLGLNFSQGNSRTGSGYQHTQSVARSVLVNSSRTSTSVAITSSSHFTRPVESYKAKAETTSVSPHDLQMNQQAVSSYDSSLTPNQQPHVYSQRPPVAPMEQARMDQIKEQMKQEDIPGEMCMDAANNATYRCIICSLAFETLDLLREHVRNVCKPGLQSSSVYTSKIEQDKANSARAGLETTTVFQCLRCFELCISEAGIKQHRLTCKRVPTVPSDIKKEAAAASANKSRARSSASSKHGSVKAESGGSSRPHSRNNTSVLSSHTQKVSNAALQNISSGAGVAVTLGANNPQLMKKEPEVQNIPSSRQSTPTKSSAVPSSAFSAPQHLPNASLCPTPTTRPSSNVSTLITSLPSNLAPNSQNSSSFSFHHPEMSSPISTFHPPSCQVKDSNVSVSQHNSALNAKPEVPIKTEVPEVPAGSSLYLLENQSCHENEPECRTSSPKYSEISGSGGSKFFRCNLCSQTLCSSSGMLDHWKECALKHKNAPKKKAQKEKSVAVPMVGQVLENVIKVIESVASGSLEEPSADHENLERLRDPCSESPPDTTSSAEGEGAESEASWDSRATFDNTTDNEQDKRTGGADFRKGMQRRNSQLDVTSEQTNSCSSSISTAKNASAAMDNRSGCSTNHLKEGIGSDEGDEDEDDASLSGSESGSSALQSTREAPPTLRDRKLLKPIQSFINETFVSPYQHFSRRMKTVLDENIVSESTTSGAESDEDHLLCRACQKAFQTHRLLVEHYASKHLQPYTVKTVSDTSSYFCHLCQKTFSTFILYMQHIPNHSTTIIQKMKDFNKSPRISLHRDRLTNQKSCGKAKRNSLSPKLAKALKSKKAATKSAADRIKRQMLLSQGQVPLERLKVMNRRRNNIRTSSEDDYSSDASNLMFRPKRPAMMTRGSDGKFPKRKRGRPRRDLLLQDNIPEDQVVTEESRQTSSSNTADEDYVASEDGNSDATISASPPSTRSRKRSGNSDSFTSNSDKRCRHFSDSGGLPHHRKDGFISELDTDSNSTTLSVSVQENGSIIPLNKDRILANTGEEAKVANPFEENYCKKPAIFNKLTVRSLSRSQKERLKYCDLNPSVILDALDLDSLSLRSVKSHSCQVAAEKAGLEECKSTEPVKSPTFLDSYLSYISSYSRVQGESSSKSPKPLTKSMSVTVTDLKEAQDKVKTHLSEPSEKEAESRPSSSQSDISWKFPVRRCSVNLGQKISLSDYELDSDEISEETESELASLRPGVPIVCLERNAAVESCMMSNSSSTTIVDKTDAKSVSKNDLTDGCNSPGTDAMDDSKTADKKSIVYNCSSSSSSDSNVMSILESDKLDRGKVGKKEKGSRGMGFLSKKVVPDSTDIYNEEVLIAANTPCTIGRSKNCEAGNTEDDDLMELSPLKHNQVSTSASENSLLSGTLESEVPKVTLVQESKATKTGEITPQSEGNDLSAASESKDSEAEKVSESKASQVKITPESKFSEERQPLGSKNKEIKRSPESEDEIKVASGSRVNKIKRASESTWVEASESLESKDKEVEITSELKTSKLKNSDVKRDFGSNNSEVSIISKTKPNKAKRTSGCKDEEVAIPESKASEVSIASECENKMINPKSKEVEVSRTSESKDCEVTISEYKETEVSRTSEFIESKPTESSDIEGSRTSEYKDLQVTMSEYAGGEVNRASESRDNELKYLESKNTGVTRSSEVIISEHGKSDSSGTSKSKDTKLTLTSTSNDEEIKVTSFSTMGGSVSVPVLCNVKENDEVGVFVENSSGEKTLSQENLADTVVVLNKDVGDDDDVDVKDVQTNSKENIPVKESAETRKIDKDENVSGGFIVSSPSIRHPQTTDSDKIVEDIDLGAGRASSICLEKGLMNKSTFNSSDCPEQETESNSICDEANEDRKSHDVCVGSTKANIDLVEEKGWLNQQKSDVKNPELAGPICQQINHLNSETDKEVKGESSKTVGEISVGKKDNTNSAIQVKDASQPLEQPVSCAATSSVHIEATLDGEKERLCNVAADEAQKSQCSGREEQLYHKEEKGRISVEAAEMSKTRGREKEEQATSSIRATVENSAGVGVSAQAVSGAGDQTLESAQYEHDSHENETDSITDHPHESLPLSEQNCDSEETADTNSATKQSPHIVEGINESSQENSKVNNKFHVDTKNDAGAGKEADVAISECEGEIHQLSPVIVSKESQFTSETNRQDLGIEDSAYPITLNQACHFHPLDSQPCSREKIEITQNRGENGITQPSFNSTVVLGMDSGLTLPDVVVQNINLTEKDGDGQIISEPDVTQTSVSKFPEKGASSGSQNSVACEVGPRSKGGMAKLEQNLPETKFDLVEENKKDRWSSACSSFAMQNGQDVSCLGGTGQTLETELRNNKEVTGEILPKSEINFEELTSNSCDAREDIKDTKFDASPEETEDNVSNRDCAKKHEVGEIQTDPGELCHQSSKVVMFEEEQGKQLEEMEQPHEDSHAVGGESRVMKESLQGDHVSTKRSKDSKMKALKNAHLSLAAFIAERLRKPQVDNQFELTSTPTISPQSPIESIVEVEPEESEPPKYPQDSVVLSQPQDPVCSHSPQDPAAAVKSEASLSSESLRDSDVSLEPSENPEGNTGLFNLALVDYSCSSEENSVDEYNMQSESEQADKKSHHMHVEIEKEMEYEGSGNSGTETETENIVIDRGRLSPAIDEKPVHSMKEMQSLEFAEVGTTLASEGPGEVGDEKILTADVNITQPEREVQILQAASLEFEENQVDIHISAVTEELKKPKSEVKAPQEEDEIKLSVLGDKSSESRQSPTPEEALGDQEREERLNTTHPGIAKSEEGRVDQEESSGPGLADKFTGHDDSAGNCFEICGKVTEEGREILESEGDKEIPTLNNDNQVDIDNSLQDQVDPHKADPENGKDISSSMESPSTSDVFMSRSEKVESGNELTESDLTVDVSNGSHDSSVPSLNDSEKPSKMVEMCEDLSEIKATTAVTEKANLSSHSHNEKSTNSSYQAKTIHHETFSDTDDGDDFELVIEKDTSSRNILSFPEKPRNSSPILAKGEANVINVVYKDDSFEEEKKGIKTAKSKPVYNPSPKKMLTGAKSLRKGELRQFVWEDDSDGDGAHLTNNIPPSKPRESEGGSTGIKPLCIPQKQSLVGEMHQKKKYVEDSRLDAVNRKRKALREKTETAPFTWDLEDHGEQPNGPGKVTCSDIVFVKDSKRTRQPSRTRESQPPKKKKSKTEVISSQGLQRPGSLKIVKSSPSEGKRKINKPSAAVSSLPADTDGSLDSSALTAKLININTTDDNIQVDDEISFKRGSLPSTPTDSPIIKTLEASAEVKSSSVNRRRKKSGSSSSNFQPDSTPLQSSEIQNGDVSHKKQSSLRSCHSSVEPSTPNSMHPSTRRARKLDEPHHKKAGLIKVGKTQSPAPASSPGASDKPSPYQDANPSKTRSSEGVGKLSKDKDLRNKGLVSFMSRKPGVKGDTPPPNSQQKTEPSTGKSKVPSAASASNQRKALTSKREGKPLKRKSMPEQTLPGKRRKTEEVVKPKINKRPASEPRPAVCKTKLKNDAATMRNKTVSVSKAVPPAVRQTKTSPGMNKAKSESTPSRKTKVEALVMPKTKSVSPVVTKTKPVTSLLHKRKTGSSVATKTKTASSAVHKTMTGSSAVSKTKIVSSVIHKTKTASGVGGRTKSGSSVPNRKKTGSSVSGKTKTGSSVISKTKSGTSIVGKAKAVSEGKKPRVSSSKTLARIGSKSVKLSGIKLPLKKISDKSKNSGASKKPVAKLAEKKSCNKK